MYYNIYKLYIDTITFRNMLMLCRYACYAVMTNIVSGVLRRHRHS